jgi:hypothetical protein
MAAVLVFSQRFGKSHTCPTKHALDGWGFRAIYKQFPHFEFFLIPNIVHAHPPAQ